VTADEERVLEVEEVKQLNTLVLKVPESTFKK